MSRRIDRLAERGLLGRAGLGIFGPELVGRLARRELLVDELAKAAGEGFAAGAGGVGLHRHRQRKQR